MVYEETHTPHTGTAIQHTYVGHHPYYLYLFEFELHNKLL